ncbi:DUF6438 domain-containing protein [Schinkia sp. CFF1]
MFERIFLSRTPCYGTCPVYEVEILQDGTAKWLGHMHVFHMGEEEFKVSKSKIKKLEALLEEFDFRSFIYPKPDIFATDHPSCIIHVMYRDGFIKEVDHYLGDMETNTEERKHSLHNLDKFERKIEQIIGLRNYIKHRPLFLFHLKSANYECVVSAQNEKAAFDLAENSYEIGDWDIIKIGKDTTGVVIPYVVMETKTGN